jgi:hypothetical protein
MPTESIEDTRTVERTATLKLVRVVDYEKLAEENGGSVTIEALKTAGDFEIVIEPNGRDAKSKRIPVADAGAGAAWLDGFEAAAKGKGSRAAK